MPIIDCGGLFASGDRQKDKQTAETIRAVCDGKTAVIQSVERQKKTAAPPKLHDLTSLQREANRLLGFTAAQTLEYAQSLYEKAVLSYPRVDSKYITSDMRGTVKELVSKIQDSIPYLGGSAFAPNIDRIINDNLVTDHHAIIPTAEVFKTDISALSTGERDILNLVIVRLLCAVAPAHAYESITAVLDCGGYLFTAKGKVVIEDGWKAVETAFKASLKTKSEVETDDDEDDNALPELSKSQTYDGVSVMVKEGSTAPPRPYTEDTLLSAMENAGADETASEVERRGLGTPATRAAIIEKLVKTGFVERVKKNLISTELGRNLISVLPETLTSPKLTATWENSLLDVHKGNLTADEFMNNITAFIKAIVADNNAPKPEFMGLFGGNKAESESLGMCPRCGAAIREASKGFFCDTKSCGFKLWKESKFWTMKKKPLSATIVKSLLKNGRVKMTGLFSEKTGKKYDATVILDDSGEGYVGFKMSFDNKA